MSRPTSRCPSIVFAAVISVLLPGLLQAGQGAAPQQSAPAQQPQAQAEVPGVRNYTRVDATFACGGALSPDAAEGIKSIVNLRAENEEGANIEAERKSAEATGLRYIWLPFVTASPDATKVDQFLQAVVEPANQPMLIHCASGGRVSMFWAIKRVMVDGWPVDKAMGELPDLSKNVSPTLKNFALDYLKQHGK
jgi:uncharacterized protein (TIGR01244 family)